MTSLPQAIPAVFDLLEQLSTEGYAVLGLVELSLATISFEKMKEGIRLFAHYMMQQRKITIPSKVFISV